MNVIQRASALLLFVAAPVAFAQTWQSGLLATHQKVADNLLQPLNVGYGGLGLLTLWQ